ncbi:MAG: ABC transporter ATP-binding protein [Fimbriimonadaceae bacterium]|nr:ABC transporter ATP-binding protein [Fimbriimonadaceae bacterium]
MEFLLQARNLSIGYGGKAHVSGFDFAVKPGEIWALLGQNGSGKSTLLRTLAGRLPAISGEALLQGKPAHLWPPQERARQVAFLPQVEEAAFDFTAYQVVMAGRTPYAKGFWETQEDVQAVLLILCAKIAHNVVVLQCTKQTNFILQISDLLHNLALVGFIMVDE